MAVIRKRLIFWLIKAYIRKSGKTIVFSFLFGLLIFFAVVFTSKYFIHLIPLARKETIGLVGAYTQDSLPPEIVDKLSSGLTKRDKDGTIKPALAASWEIMDKGKTYRFHLKQHQYFNDGKEVTSETINYDFSDVTEERPDKYTIVFKLHDAYAPFLVTVSRPIFDHGFNGVGAYQLKKVKLNGNFVQSLTLQSTKTTQDTINYEFYPTEESLKMAYLLGEVTEVKGLTSQKFDAMKLQNFPNTKLNKVSDDTQLVTLFFNTTDESLSDKRLRLALSYALPDTFAEGKRTYLPYAPKSIYYNNDLEDRTQDIAHAKLLLLPDQNSSGSAATAPKEVTIKTLPKYHDDANAIAAAWKQLGIKSKIEEVDHIPNNFQIFLGDFSIPDDPDQYTLWHSDQRNNITHYKNLRIDKLLEDGRKTVDEAQRKQIYADFQKYLLEDAPAAFLYFPIEYTLIRK